MMTTMLIIVSKLDEPDMQGRAHKSCNPMDPPTYGQAKAGRTYIQHLCKDVALPEAMNDWEKWRERVSDIYAIDTTRHEDKRR